MIDREDEKRIGKMIMNTVIDAMEQVLFPRFDKIENQINNLKEDVGELKQAVEILDSDMGGVKMRLKVIETKLDTNADNTLVVRDHEKRITKLEKSLA